MVLVTLLTGTDASIDVVETLTVVEGVVSEDEDDDEDELDMGGGPEPKVAAVGLEMKALEIIEAVVEGAVAGMEILWTGAGGGSTE